MTNQRWEGDHIWHSTGPEAYDGHKQVDCPGQACPVTQMITSQPVTAPDTMRCSYVCSSENWGEPWRCGQTVGHMGSHVLYGIDSRVLPPRDAKWDLPKAVPSEVTAEEIEEFCERHLLIKPTQFQIQTLLHFIKEKTQ